VPTAAVGSTSDDGSPTAVDTLLEKYARQQEERIARARTADLERLRFSQAADCTFERIVHPALTEIAAHLNRHGGGGLVEECAAEGRHGRRVTLWMSLEGPVATPPRVDRNPYIQLEVDVPWRRVSVWEGDMWNNHGASRRTEPFSLEQVTTATVTQRTVQVLRRTVDLDKLTGEKP
jgi:hypothetical protein